MEEELSLVLQHKNKIIAVFQDELWTELFNGRCHDTGEQITEQAAQLFREELLRKNTDPLQINLKSLRIGINAVIALSNNLGKRKIQVLDLSDNGISDYGMHAIKNVIENAPLKQLILASNMISGEGLEILCDVLAYSHTLERIDFGVVPGSIRKNSLSKRGALTLATVLIKNTYLKQLILDDNDLGTEGGECIGIAMTQNQTLEELKISENQLKSEGAMPILRNSKYLLKLDLSKNFIKNDVGPSLSRLLKHNKIQELNVSYNEILAIGAEYLAKGLKQNDSLHVLNVKANILGDNGIFQLVGSLYNNASLQELNVSLNEIGPLGGAAIAQVLPNCEITSLSCSRNFFGNEAILVFAELLVHTKLKQLDIATCRVGDAGVEAILTNALYSNLTGLKLKDNFISEKLENTLINLTQKNQKLLKLDLVGNRLSHACILRINKSLERNQKAKENSEPSKLLAQIYQRQFEAQKLQSGQEQLDEKKKEVKRLQEKHTQMMTQMDVVRDQERNRRQVLRDKVQEQKTALKQKKEHLEELKGELQDMQIKYDKEVKNLQGELDVRKEELQKLQNEYRELIEANQDLETDFPEQLEELELQIQTVEEETKEIEENTTMLNDQLRMILTQKA